MISFLYNLQKYFPVTSIDGSSFKKNKIVSAALSGEMAKNFFKILIKNLGKEELLFPKLEFTNPG